jgi:hypothetical protein
MRAVCILLLALSARAAPVVSNYSAEVRRDAAGNWTVHVIATVSGGEWSKPAFTLGPFRTGQFAGCETCEAKPQGALLRFSGGLDLTYRVTPAPAGEREYIPLAVPEIAGSGVPGSVNVFIDGVQSAVDTFPEFQRSDGRLTARMANIVNHVEFGPGRPKQWSDLAVVLMIVGGLVIRRVLTR